MILGTGGDPLFRWPSRKSVKILESSARGSYPVMLADKFDYFATEYDRAAIDQGRDPRAYADFQKLQFGDGEFDVVIASDVFEHVRRDRQAFAEILRVLKPGGSLVLTVPYDHSREKTIQRVDTSGESDIHLLEPEYHGGGGHTLTYRNYGRDLLSLMHTAGFSVVHLFCDVPASGITPQSVFIARKGEYAEISEVAVPPPQAGSVGILLPFRLFLLFKYNVGGFFHYWKEARRKNRS